MTDFARRPKLARPRLRRASLARYTDTYGVVRGDLVHGRYREIVASGKAVERLLRSVRGRAAQRARAGRVLALASLLIASNSGCGLILDLDPVGQSVDPLNDGGLESRPAETDSSSWSGDAFVGGPFDASGRTSDAGTDAGDVSVDATASDDAIVHGPDARTDAGAAKDGGSTATTDAGQPVTGTCDGFGICACDTGAPCAVTCENRPECSLQCADNATCSFDLAALSNSNVSCGSGSSCSVSARNVQNLENVRCEAGSSCSVVCVDGSNCFVDCIGDARCALECTRVSNCDFEVCSQQRESCSVNGTLRRTCGLPCA